VAGDQTAHHPVLEVLQPAATGSRNVVDDVHIVGLDTPDDHDSYPSLWR
jgi:hypothetical protein